MSTIDFDRMYGVTHDMNGAPRVIEPKAIKVGIGLAKGPALHAYIDKQGRWILQIGVGRDRKNQAFAGKEEIKAEYYKLARNAAKREFPERLTYFTFTSGDLEPAWDLIESHGSMPAEIDIIFIREDPFFCAYQWYSATEKRCEGNGKEALRLNTLANGDKEKAAAREAHARGEKYFGVDKCWTADCQYSKPQGDKPSPCSPIGRLAFQLLKSPRIGGTAIFNTRGFKSIQQIYSSIQLLRNSTGRGNHKEGFIAGIPLTMVLGPYQVVHDGKRQTQYAVRLEFRANSALELKQKLIAHAVGYRQADTNLLEQLSKPPAIEVEAPEAIAAELSAPVESAPQQEPDKPPASEIHNPEDPALGPAGPLANAWDKEPEGSGSQQQSSRPARISAAAAQKFYDACRAKGMTDPIIINHLGSLGFEEPKEITVDKYSELMRWAEQYRPAQGRML